MIKWNIWTLISGYHPLSRGSTWVWFNYRCKHVMLALPCHWPLWGEFTDDRWIPYTKSQWREKCLHLMTTSFILPKMLGKVAIWILENFPCIMAWLSNRLSYPQGSLLQTWFIFDHSIWINSYIPGKVWGMITYLFINFTICTVEVQEWTNNFIPHFIIDVITYPCWD